MPKMKEEVFEAVFRTGAVKSVKLVPTGLNFIITYHVGDVSGCIHTQRGEPKPYRIATAMRFLKRIGLADVGIDMRGWSPDRPGLL